MRILLALAAVAAILVAGCAMPKDGTSSSPPTSSPGNGFAPQQGTAHGSTEGVDLDVTWRACEDGFCAHATATNRGASAVQISSICESPWSERMTRDGETVNPHQSMAMCLAYGRRAFAPGESLQTNFTWDGKLWSGSPEKASPAPDGSYTWTLAFWFEASEGGPRRESAADVHLIIGET